jgi:hypothetical protein
MEFVHKNHLKKSWCHHEGDSETMKLQIKFGIQMKKLPMDTFKKRGKKGSKSS